MATFVLHANTPCAGKGNVSTLSGPNHSIAVSVAGVGAVFAQFQVWGREDGSEPGKINGLVTVSGTTSATQTVTFTGRYKEIWLGLVGISAASTFSATITTLETEFATNAELDAAVAANGGQSLGPFVSVAGVLWDWSAARGRYIPGNAVSFATSTALPTLANTSQDIGVQTWLVNPLAPNGMTRMYWTGTLWAPVPNQLLARFANADGTPLLDLTASALTVGAWSEVWASAILPDWMVLQPQMKLSLGADTQTWDATSTATEQLRISMRSAASSEGDANNSILGHSSPAVNYSKGFSSGRADFIVSNGRLLATTGLSWYSTTAQSRRFIGTVGSSPRLRIDFWPGANTNRVVHYSASLYSA